MLDSKINKIHLALIPKTQQPVAEPEYRPTGGKIKRVCFLFKKEKKIDYKY
jgi:hypothetical protein